MKKIITTCALLLVLAVPAAEASLITYSNGLVYDDVNNISWTRNASLVGNTPGVEALVFAGFSEYRVPTIDELQGAYDQISALNGCGGCLGNLPPFFSIGDFYRSSTPGVTPFTIMVLFFQTGGQLEFFGASYPLYWPFGTATRDRFRSPARSS